MRALEFKKEFKEFSKSPSLPLHLEGFGRLAGLPAYGSKRGIRMLEGRLVQAREVARTLGIKTGTLAKWRREGKGPKKWVRLGRTSVAYPLAEVERFLRELEGTAPDTSSERAG